jgi:hypothetical protein
MNNLFDLQGSKVVIHPYMLGIPCFKKIWESNDDKGYATNLISYIILKHHFSSPYVENIGDLEYRDAKLKSELFEEGWTADEDLLYAEKTFLEFSNTLLVQLLDASRHAVYMISVYLKDIVAGTMDMRMVKEALTAMSTLDKVVKSLDSLAKQVRREDMESSTVRGGSEIGHFEIPKAR